MTDDEYAALRRITMHPGEISGVPLSLLQRGACSSEVGLHLVEARTQGQALPPLVAALRAAEARKAVLLTEREGLAQFATVASFDRKRMERDLTVLAGDARGLLGRHPREARRVLQTLLVDRLECAPFRAGPVTGYRFAGAASYGGLLAGAACAHQ